MLRHFSLNIARKSSNNRNTDASKSTSSSNDNNNNNLNSHNLDYPQTAKNSSKEREDDIDSNDRSIITYANTKAYDFFNFIFVQTYQFLNNLLNIT